MTGRTNLVADPVWQARTAEPAGGPLSIVSASWDGSRLYVGGGNATININRTSCYANISALNSANGATLFTYSPGAVPEGT